jgi:hypothetical protein
VFSRSISWKKLAFVAADESAENLTHFSAKPISYWLISNRRINWLIIVVFLELNHG